MYRNGVGVSQDQIHARQLLQQSCDRDSAVGCYYLGEMFRRGEGIDQDDQQAVIAFTSACHGNSKAACESLKEMGLSAL